jgi:hypothetical protein
MPAAKVPPPLLQASTLANRDNPGRADGKMKVVHLTVVANETEAEILCSLLRTEHIHCTYERDLSSTAYGGGGATEVLVDEKDLARALELLRADV